MRDRRWCREALIAEIRENVWRYLSPASTIETQLLEAAAILNMPASEVRVLAHLQFLVSDQARRLLENVPSLLRRLATTTVAEEEWSIEQVRGAIQWQKTLALRATSGLPHLYVTSPARRAYQTPENELLVFLLDAMVTLGRGTGWQHSSSEKAGSVIRERTAAAEHWRHSRMLAEVERREPSATKLARIANGRHRLRYQPVLDAYQVYKILVAQLDRQGIQRAVETHGLVTRDDPTLFELFCLFRILDALRELGWTLEKLRLFEGSLGLSGMRDGETLEFYYQRSPAELCEGSIYRDVQQRHALRAGGLLPDFVIRRAVGNRVTWLLVEAKGGESGVAKLARAALYDLLAYRRAFDPVLSLSVSPYGVGVAWGEGLDSAAGAEVVLCTPDTLPSALAKMLGRRSDAIYPAGL